MRTLLFASLVTASACASAPLVIEPQPAGYQAKLDADANPRPESAHDRAVDRAVHAGPVGYACGDTVLNDQLTTGGLPVTSYMPCWDYQDEAEHDDQRALAAPPRVESKAADRQAIKGLAESEIAACAHIPERERDHSPFAHRRSIAEVMPHFEAGVLRGVRVVFKPVGALTADWMRQDIACHQAHVAVLGSIPDTLAQDPTLVQNAEVTVSDTGGHLTVVVRTDSPDQAALALAKAQGKGPSASVAVGGDN